MIKPDGFPMKPVGRLLKGVCKKDVVIIILLQSTYCLRNEIRSWHILLRFNLKVAQDSYINVDSLYDRQEKSNQSK